MSNITWHTEQRRLGDLIDWDKNPRQLSKHDAEHIHRSLDTFGLADPLIINTDDRLIGGHQRKRILLSNGATSDTLVDVRVPSRPLTDREAEELAIRLNKNSGDWDFDLLANGFDVPDLLDWGFTEEELQIGGFTFADKPEDPGAQMDKAEELREKWGVETGQLWQLGDHRLICGDCTDKAVVERVMDGEKADMVFADPPYNAGVAEWDRDFVWSHDWIIDIAPIVIVTPGIVSIKDFMNLTAMPYIWSIGARITNGRARSAIGFGNWIYAAVFAKESIYRQAQDFIEVDLIPGQAKDGVGHRGQKPLPFMERIVELYGGDLVFDPFLGSGTTLIACERLGRKCRAVEISPAYCAVAIQRWVDMTGGEPILLDKQDV